VADCVFERLGHPADRLANTHAPLRPDGWLLLHPGQGPFVDLSGVSDALFLGLGNAVLVAPGLELDVQGIGEVDPVHGCLGMDPGERTAFDHPVVENHVDPLVLDLDVSDLAGLDPAASPVSPRPSAFLKLQAHDPAPLGAGADE
jgi:hypothetical protein